MKASRSSWNYAPLVIDGAVFSASGDTICDRCCFYVKPAGAVSGCALANTAAAVHRRCGTENIIFRPANAKANAMMVALKLTGEIK